METIELNARVAGIVIFVIGDVVMAAGAVTWLATGRAADDLKAKRVALEAERDSTRARILDTNLRYRGFEGGISTIPDSLRLGMAGQMIAQSKVYGKQLHILGVKERDQTVQIEQLRRQESTARHRARGRGAPVAGAGAILAVAGLALFGVSRRRPVAA